jgi:acid stress-induced BolA-like protein IbaG/YrbA
MNTMNEQIADSIRQRLPGAEVEVALDGNRALITVVSAQFEPMTRVQKQQAVYACIDAYIRNGSLHAVTIRALTPAER